MTYHKSFSLSVQKELEKRNICIESEFDKSITNLNIRSMMHRCNIYKQKGYHTITIMYVILILPLIHKAISALWSVDYFQQIIDAKKDTYYRFLNNERFNWRNFIYYLFTRISAASPNVPLKDKVLIADDTIAEKTGKNMELVSYHFDHAKKRSILGYQYLQLGFHDGIRFFPIDAAVHVSKKRPNDHLRDIDKRTLGWRRRQEAFKKKTDVLIEMLRRAYAHGVNASFVLFDSWFGNDSVISKVIEVGYGVICKIKKSNQKFIFEGKTYTIRQLWRKLNRNRAVYISAINTKAICVDVELEKSGKVRLIIVLHGNKSWTPFLCTDCELSVDQIIEYYTRRWTIEVFFRDAKQLLYLGKQQSKTFDAVIASYSMVMIRYLLLVYILSKYQLYGSIAPLFHELSEIHQEFSMTQKVWGKIKKIILLSSHIISSENEPEKMLLLIDIIEDILMDQIRELSAKL
jgi:IS4 transposase